MLHLILADSELETVPSEMASIRTLRRRADERDKRVTDLILDSNYHHKFMKKLEDSERRGRPDIVQVCMLTVLDSPLSREGLLRFYVHSRNDRVIEIDPETRIPRSYNRFIGLMEKLFLEKQIPPDKPLLKMRNLTVSRKLKEIGPKSVITMEKGGGSFPEFSVFRDFEKNDDICVMVGGFPHGSFISEVEKLSDRVVSIYPESLNAVTVLNHIVQFYEMEFMTDDCFHSRGC